MATEKRLIDANGSYTLNASDNTGYSLCFGGGIISAMDEHGRCVCEFYADDAPTVDAVEVVRCKDCRWARLQDHREPSETPAHFLIRQCFMHHHIPAPWGARLAVKPDDFCSYGERRTNV